MEVKRILWPTDLSEQSTKVMPVLTSQAANYGATIVVLHVMDEMVRLDSVIRAMGRDEAERFRQAVRSDADETLDKICSMLGDSCPNYEKHVSEGDPAEEIIKFIGDKDIDMVVMPSYGEKNQKAYSSANVAREVVKHADVPVLTVPV
jgi:nucleotide-binding universal stress UspA family protein